jgi:hypothetical protein
MSFVVMAAHLPVGDQLHFDKPQLKDTTAINRGIARTTRIVPETRVYQFLLN